MGFSLEKKGTVRHIYGPEVISEALRGSQRPAVIVNDIRFYLQCAVNKKLNVSGIVF